MSKDIRTFFTVISKKSGKDSSKPKPQSSKKKAKRLIDSDDEDIIAKTPEVANSKKQKKATISDSDNEVKLKPSVKSVDLSKLKPVNISDIFKKDPVKQSEVKVVPEFEKKEEKPKVKKKKKGRTEEAAIHDNKAFEETLNDLDDSIFEENLDVLEKTVIDVSDKNETTPARKDRKRTRTDSASDRGTPKKTKFEHTDSGIDPGQEAHEKKRYLGQMYQKYLQRAGPKYHGQKELPKGKSNCLQNLCFVRTGVLDSLEDEEFKEIIKQHGGRTVSSVTKKVNYIVVGSEPGQAKLASAANLGIPKISEDELLDMILVKSGMEAKYCKKVSEDQGIVSCEDFDVKSPPKKHSSEIPSQKQSQSRDTKLFEIKPVLKKLSETKAESTKVTVDDSTMSFTEKYKPKDLKEIIGQQEHTSNMNRLKRWLINWYKNQTASVRKTLVKPTPWMKNDDGAYFKAALLSGPPGVGKTTTATLVCQALGLDIVEFNASDTRSKKLLHEEVSQLLCTNTIADFASGKGNVNKKRVLLMDEVDGMAGNEDRGGIQELINLIKNASIPVICMCNDRYHQKIRSLVNYCYDLRFSSPKLEQIKGAMLSVCFQEGLNITPDALSELISGTGCDIRQTLNHISVWAAGGKNVTLEEAAKEAKLSKKDSVMGAWEVCRTVFTHTAHRHMSVSDKARLFYFDYSIGPLFVHENYLKVEPFDKKKSPLLRAAFAADALSMGDIVDAKIRRGNNWALLETESIFMSVLPGYHMSGNICAQINFPSWLGKNSKKNKFNRILCEIQSHTRISASASKMAVKLDYLTSLRNAILQPLKEGMNGVQEAVNVMKTYNLLREDLDGLLELSQWRKGNNPMSGIDTKVKAAFTRTYNKQVKLLPFAATSAISKKKTAAVDEGNFLADEEAEETDNEDDDDLTNNAMIKVKKPTESKGKKVAEAGTSKRGKGGRKGK